ncbi:MAG: transglycosylase SLT domain-containing protein [Saprospiraceae bacterium]
MKYRHYLNIAIFLLQPLFSRAEFSINSTNAGSINEKVLFNYYEEEIIVRLKGMSTIVDMSMDDDVLGQVKRYVVSDRSGSKSILIRAELYFPLIEKLLFDNNLPFQLKNLAALESALNPKACSYAGAAGLWQLMPETARRNGLKINKYIDERLDPVASTLAAINYLKKLYSIFGDWSLVLAAYNCGENKILSLMDETGSNDFATIKKFLPRQTQLFVPTFIGVSYMLEFYGQHDLNPESANLPSQYLTFVKIDRPVNLKKLFKESAVDKEIFRLYNPSVKQTEINKNENGIYINLPDSMMVDFVDYYLNLYKKDVVVNNIAESVQDNLIRELISFSRPFIDRPEEISVVQPENIEYNSLEFAKVDDVPEPVVEWSSDKEYYTLKTGESLTDVASFYDKISVKDLMEWNNISENDILSVGTVLTIKN